VLGDLGGGLSDEAPERSGEVRLVEIVQATNYVENRNSLSKQICGISRSFDLPKRGESDARGAQKVSLGRAHG
jgi:hypothetical protein